MRQILYKTPIAATFTAIAAGSTLTVTAQPGSKSAGVLEEVIHTARSREEVSQGVPMAYTPMAVKFVRQNNIYRSEDIQYFEPGMRLVHSGQSDQNPVVASRGRTSKGVLIHLEPAVPCFFNDAAVALMGGAD